MTRVLYELLTSMGSRTVDMTRPPLYPDLSRFLVHTPDGQEPRRVQPPGVRCPNKWGLAQPQSAHGPCAEPGTGGQALTRSGMATGRCLRHRPAESRRRSAAPGGVLQTGALRRPPASASRAHAASWMHGRSPGIWHPAGRAPPSGRAPG